MDEELKGKIEAYLDGNGQNPAEDIKKAYSKVKDINDRFSFVNSIENTVKDIEFSLLISPEEDADKKLPSFKKKLLIFQDSFVPEEKKGRVEWKSFLLNIPDLKRDAIDTSNTIKRFDVYDPEPVSLESRIRSVSPKFSSTIENTLQGEALKEALSINIGSSYVLPDKRKEKERISGYKPSHEPDDDPNLHVCMDAAHYGRMSLGNGRYAIFSAVADGAAGHFSKLEDHDIAKTSDCAAKFAVNYMRSATKLSAGNPDKLESYMKNMRYAVAEELYKERSSQHPGLGTTLAFSTVIVEKDGSQRAIGGNIGDSMIASYNHQEENPKERWQTLSAARKDGWGPDMIKSDDFFKPEAVKQQEVRTFNTSLPKGAFLLPMTDGVYEGLPCTTRSSQVGENEFVSYSLDSASMLKIEKENPTAKDVQDFIKRKVETHINNERKTSEERGVGDDYTLMVIDATKIAEIGNHSNILKGIDVEKEKDGTMKFTARSEKKMQAFQNNLEILGINEVVTPKGIISHEAGNSIEGKELFNLAEKKLNPSLMRQAKRVGKKAKWALIDARDNLKDIGNSIKGAGSKVGSKLSNLSKNLPKGKSSGRVP